MNINLIHSKDIRGKYGPKTLWEALTCKRVYLSKRPRSLAQKAWMSGIALALVMCVMFGAYGTRYMHQQLIRGERRRQHSCDSGLVNGSWVVGDDEYRNPRYLLNAEEDCNYNYIYGRQMMEHLLRSGLKVDVWGDSTQSQLVGSMLCFFSGVAPWNGATMGALYLPTTKPSYRTRNGKEVTGKVSWIGAKRCYGGNPQPRVRTCSSNKFTSECRFDRLEFSWHIKRDQIHDTENYVAPLKKKDTTSWVPPTVTYRWAGQVTDMKKRLKDWIRENPGHIFESDVLVLGTGTYSTMQDDLYLQHLEKFLRMLTVKYARVFKNTEIVWIESNPLPPNPDAKFTKTNRGNADFRRLESLKLARKYNLNILHVEHLVKSSPEFATATDIHYPSLSEHRAQLVINYLARII